MYLEARSKPSKWAYRNKEIKIPLYDYKEIECLHLRCTECGGSGLKANGTTCVHMISCKCKMCSPGIC